MKMNPEKDTSYRKKIFYLGLLGIFFTQILHAVPDYTLRKYKVENGLSHHTAYCALQDSSGLVWIGTANGLNCFDGTAFRAYYIRHPEINSNRILSLAELDARTLLVGTNGGIYVYDKKEGKGEPLTLRTRYGVSISSEVKRIVKDRSGQIWIATLGQGLFRWNPSTGQLTQNSAYSSFLVDLCISNDIVYLATLQEGWFALDLEGQCKYKQTLTPPGVNAPATLSALLAADETVWTGSAGGDVIAYHAIDGKMKNRFHLCTKRQEAILCFVPMREGRLMIGTSDGAYLLDPRTGIFETAASLIGEPMPGSHLNAILQDREKGLWMLTEQDGINYLAWHTRHFERFTYAMQENEGKGETIIGPLCEDSTGGLWVGTRYGLWKLSANEHLLRPVPVATDTHLQIDVTALLQTRTDLWIGTNGNGLAAMNLSTGKVRWYRHSGELPRTIGSDVILALHQTRAGDIYIGTAWGLCRYNRETDDFLTVTTVGMMVEVVDLHEDTEGCLWVATRNSGLFRCQLDRGEWKHFQASADESGLSVNSIVAMLEGRDGTLWFATDGGGLVSYDRASGAFSRLGTGTKAPIPSVIQSIEEDAKGNLWLSSYWGIMRITPSDLNLSVYTVSDGLQSNQLCPRSSLFTREGWLFFGGMNGLNACRPEHFWQNRYVPPVVITDLNFPYVEDAAEAALLKGTAGPLIEKEVIRLPWHTNSFGISFAALSYSDPSRNRYRYRLHGIDRKWISGTPQTTAYYTDLPPGTYEFEVKGSNNDAVWNEESRRLTLVITPQWWRSGWAYVVYIGLAILLFYLLGRRRNEYLKQKYNERMEQFRVMQEKETYRSKVGFFVNLVHEIRTPLSLIRLPLDEVLDQPDLDRQREKIYLETIRRNVDYLLGITNELLDFQKMENEGLKFSLHPCDVVLLVRNIAAQFDENLHLKGKELEISLPEGSLHALTDAGKLSKVIVNFLSNAMKYARRRIRLELTADGDRFHLAVSDDGPGIQPEERARIFTAFYQINNEHQMPGTGIGLAFSRTLAEGLNGTLELTESAWGGSCFTLSLPLGNPAVSSETGTVEALAADKKEEIPENAALNGRKFTVLMVEDNPELLALTTQRLAAWFVVEKAENGQKALDILKKDTVDLIVSDVMMPVMDGIELCRAVKQNLQWSHIPLILLTAKTSLEAKTEGAECGADVYLEKPFSIRQLKAQIENLLRLRIAYYQIMQHLAVQPTPQEPSATDSPVLSQRDYELVNQIKTTIEQRMGEADFCIDALADALHMSRSNFYRKLKALAGMAPNDYLKVVRLNRAAELLRQGNRVSDIYVEVGFSSASYFTKCFKEHFGILPKDFVAKEREPGQPEPSP